MVRAGLRLDMQNSSQERRRNSAPPPPKPRGGPSALAGVRGASRSGSASVLTTHALFAREVQRKLSDHVAGFAAAGPSSDRKRSRPIRGSRRRRVMANVRAERLLKTPAEPSPELRIPALQLKREWSPWPEFGSDPGNPRELSKG